MWSPSLFRVKLDNLEKRKRRREKDEKRHPQRGSSVLRFRDGV
jgi:hypothetical protein